VNRAADVARARRGVPQRAPHDGYNYLALFARVAELASAKPGSCIARKQVELGCQTEETAEEGVGRKERPNEGVAHRRVWSGARGLEQHAGPFPLGETCAHPFRPVAVSALATTCAFRSFLA
jgi:hypothetical protein